MSIEHTQRLAKKAIRSFEDLIRHEDPEMGKPTVLAHLMLFNVALLAGHGYDRLNDDDLRKFTSSFGETLYHGLRSVDALAKAEEIVRRTN
jgi:hypothetical protein